MCECVNLIVCCICWCLAMLNCVHKCFVVLETEYIFSTSSIGIAILLLSTQRYYYHGTNFLYLWERKSPNSSAKYPRVLLAWNQFSVFGGKKVPKAHLCKIKPQAHVWYKLKVTIYQQLSFKSGGFAEISLLY